jgi:pantetheine-phosphate adenylyltransferase
MFTTEERMAFIEKAFAGNEKVKVVSYQGLTVNFCKKLDIPFILRGLRNPADFEFERAIAHTNRDLAGVETLFLLTAVQTSHISSSIVRDVIRNRGDYTLLVPESVRIENIEKYYIH